MHSPETSHSASSNNGRAVDAAICTCSSCCLAFPPLTFPHACTCHTQQHLRSEPNCGAPPSLLPPSPSPSPPPPPLLPCTSGDAGEVERALTVAEEMKALGAPRDKTTYALLLAACNR